ncbi:hypothetical protein FKM82_015956 [Ascaphus truei]
MSVLVMNTEAEDETIIETKQGKVSGIHLSVLSGSVTAYLGIPYGEPPTGEQRFKHPVPRKPWQGIHEAIKFGNSCYQSRNEVFTKFPGIKMWLVNNDISEDCLHLNVWVPSAKPKSVSVMVFIHGGGFISGTTSLDIYDGSILAYSEEVIVVSMNYRVGALGFLALPGNKDAPGNAGLFDQRLALQWVHENIAAFGGNPHSVTIFGHSAGAVSVGYHMISPGSHTYFTRAIMQSGSPSSDWAVQSHQRARKLTVKLAEVLGCPLDDDDTVMTCLRSKDPKELIKNQLLAETTHTLTHFIPVLDNDFLIDIPDNLIKQNLKNTEILLGATKDDGNPFSLLGGPGFSLNHESLITTAELEEGLRLFFPSAGELGVESILLQYTDWEDVDNREKNREAMELILRDYYFTCPMKYFANQAADHRSNVFFYEYDHRSSQEVWPEWMGALHGAELTFVFGKPLIENKNYTNAEHLFSKRMLKFWANFAKNGSPNCSEEAFIWPHYTSTDQKYAVLKVDGAEVQHKLNCRHCQFWNSFYPKLLKKLGK